MKPILLLCLLATACAAKNSAKFAVDPTPKFANSHAFVEKPEQLRLAARAVLEELTQASDPPASGAVHEDDTAIRTGWVYGQSKDKYISYLFNGTPKRKALPVRRKLAYHVAPSLAGSLVTVIIEEEIQELDLKTGEPLGWKNIAPDQNWNDQLIKKIREKIRAL